MLGVATLRAGGAALAVLLVAAAPGRAATSQAEALVDGICMACHGNPATRAPSRASLHAMSPDFIVDALTTGIMKDAGAGLAPDQRVAVAEYLTGAKIGTQAAMAGRCTAPAPGLDLAAPSFNGWGAGVANARYQPDPGISAAQLPRLAVAWAFGFPGVVAMLAQPTTAGGRVFIGGQNGHVYALDAQSGCFYWDWRHRGADGDHGGPCRRAGRGAVRRPARPGLLGRRADRRERLEGDRRRGVTLPGGRRLLTIGQKSGMVWALDPDDGGRIVWQQRVGAGGPLGGRRTDLVQSQ